MEENKVTTTENEIVLYRPNETITIEVRLENDTIWLAQAQIAELFGVGQPAISKHIKNIYSSGELTEKGTYSILEYMGNDGQQKYVTKYYNLDMNLARLYDVETKVLNQAVKRNIERFPERFMFQLTDTELIKLVTICDRFNSLKHSSSFPYAFTEHGVTMLASVLKSDMAVQISIKIVDAYIRKFIFCPSLTRLSPILLVFQRHRDLALASAKSYLNTP